MGKKTILIIEDEDAIRRALSLAIKKAGCHVLEAEDGKKGLEIALEKKPDLILLDIIMPRLDGISLLRALRKDDWGKYAHVVVLTNFTEAKRIEENLDKMVDGFMVKTENDIHDVVKKISKFL